MSQGALFATIFTVIIIIGGILIRKNKFYFGLQIIWTLLLICGNTYSDDFVGNSNLYYSSTFIDIHREGFFMSGYYYLSALFNKIGFNYIQFNALFATISTLIMVGIILKLSKNPCLTFSMFMFYPLTSSIIQKSYPKLYRAAYAFDSVKDLGLNGFEVSFNNKKFTIPVIGKAKLLDASLAISVASYLGFEDEEIISGLKSVNTLFGRSRLVKESGLEIIEDCYNANLPSSIDAIRTISSINTKGNKHVVLADMRELGCESVPSHKRLAQELSCADVDDILLYGNEVKATYNTLIELGLKDKVFYTPDFNTLCEETKKRAKKGDIVLLKGSRVMALERLYPTLREVC